MEYECNHQPVDTERIQQNIEKYGCHVTMVQADSYLPGFAYSIGLYKNFGHPEIICFGLKLETMHELINEACDIISKGKRLESGGLYDEFLDNYKVTFIDVAKEHHDDYLGIAINYYGADVDFPAVQLVWPDKQHNFPWDDDFNKDWVFTQPLLDRNTDFKFYEARNTTAFTTKQVLDGEPVLYVYHNLDGDWQFHSNDDPNTDDGRIVSLEEIVKSDPSINNIYHLQYGWSAWRSSKEEKWQYAPYEEDDQ
ncbi:DUF4262 domain-containing protein [Mucilaginibacter sp. JRF]|uniref:DUF4262 domain-containing protein n=1 Tax=Mucilaginibacter sp. JRF TaxID=2780088 RepID=UPI00187E6A61|nr:DUF4262 domain-containing protein [Mucilaginibacter sp. JRF]MBE9585066.1 DUF4262 domain-containing protein [Mucilaginibacter sp. JRF]